MDPCQRSSKGSSAPSTRASSGSITGIPSRTAYASRSGRHTSSCALPAPEPCNGPLQIGQTNKSSNRLSTTPPRLDQTPSHPRNALLNGLSHDFQQDIGFG